MVDNVNKMELKVKLKREFEEKHKCNFDYEYEGVFPKYSETKQKWVHVQRGQIWKAYAEFLEYRTTILTAENKRLREALERIHALIVRSTPSDECYALINALIGDALSGDRKEVQGE